MSRRGFRKRQVPSKAIDLNRDLPRLEQWLEARRIKAMLRGYEHSLTVADVNRRLYPRYDKGRTHRCEASPGLLLLRVAERAGLVSSDDGYHWRDARHKTTIGEFVKGAR